MSKFYKIYIMVVAAFLALLVMGAVFFNIVLADYEKSTIQTVAGEFFDEKISAFKIGDKVHTSFENPDKINAAFKQSYEGKELVIYAAKAGTDGSQNYVVKTGDERVLTFSVKESGEKTAFGFSKYEVVDVKLDFSKEYVIKAPEKSEVLVNGKPLGAEFLTEKHEFADVKLPDSLTPQKFVFYKVAGLVADPEVKAKNQGGNELAVFTVQNKNEFVVEPDNDNDLYYEHKDYVIEAMKGYAEYIQCDGTFQNINKYFEKGTETYRSIQSQVPGFVWAHDSWGFEDEWAGEFYKYSDTVFTCRVKFTQILYKQWSNPYKDYIDLTVTMHKVGGKYMVYSLKNNT